MTSPDENAANSAKKFLLEPQKVLTTQDPDLLKTWVNAILHVGSEIQPKGKKWFATRWVKDILENPENLQKPLVSGAVVKDDKNLPIVTLTIQSLKTGENEVFSYELKNELPRIEKRVQQISAKLYHDLSAQFDQLLHERTVQGSSRDRSDLIRQMVVFALENPEFNTHTKRDIA